VSFLVWEKSDQYKEPPSWGLIVADCGIMIKQSLKVCLEIVVARVLLVPSAISIEDLGNGMSIGMSIHLYIHKFLLQK